MISEQTSDILIKYVYVVKFHWHDPSVAESMAGNPITGRIYRSAFNVNTKHHRLLLPDGLVMGFNVLTGVREDSDFELVEVTIDNILDLDIKEEDLDVFLKDDTDIFSDNIERNLKQALMQHSEDEGEASDRASHTIMSLFQISPSKFEVILELADRLIESEMTAHEDITSWMRYHPNKGLALNTAKAMKAIDIYCGDNKRTNEDPEDLYEALEAIIIELERVQE